MRFAVDQQPALGGTPVSGLPVSAVGFWGKARIDDVNPNRLELSVLPAFQLNTQDS